MPQSDPDPDHDADATATTDLEALSLEAADLFLRLKADPDNANLLAEREAFLARGKVAQEVWRTTLKAWSGTKPKPRPKTLPIAALLAVLLSGLFFAREPLTIRLLADVSTARSPEVVRLASGDQVALDAGSAIADVSNPNTRAVDLLDGSAYFDVARTGLPFEVRAGAVTVSVVGTAFEVTRFDDGGTVAVTEGEVAVQIAESAWSLTPGIQLTWSETGAVETAPVEVTDVALWREDRLVADGRSFAEVADLLDRRMRGTIVIPDGRLGALPMAGNVDLSDPALALDTLAASRNARVLRLSPLLMVIVPQG